LRRYVEKQEIVKEGITEGLFQNGVFNKIPCVNKWTNKMRGRGAKEVSIKYFSSIIKRVCQGILTGGERIPEWGIKHPARLTSEDGLAYISEMQKRGMHNRNHRLALRNFLRANNVEDWDEISGHIEETGKFAHLKIPREKVYEIFDWLKSMNEISYLASKFAYKTGARKGAVLKAHAKYVNVKERKILLMEKAVLHKKKRPTPKVIPDDLWEELLPRIQKGGLLFPIDGTELCGLLRSAYEKIIPELAKEIPMPFHFWRHQFAQHSLDATDWNTPLVAKWGDWTTQTLEKYYGKMDDHRADVRAREVLPNI